MNSNCISCNQPKTGFRTSDPTGRYLVYTALVFAVLCLASYLAYN